MTNNAVKRTNESETEVSIDCSDISDIEKIKIEGIDYKMGRKSKYIDTNKEIYNEDKKNKDSNGYLCIFATYLIGGSSGLGVGAFFSMLILFGSCYIVSRLLKNKCYYY